jgi:cytochrome c biogenesis protein ResB
MTQNDGTTQPRGNPPGWAERSYAFLVSPRLAIALLVTVLVCCLIGVTVFKGAEAGQKIFATLWFNGLLVLLAISSAAAFFSRIWKRKLTLVSAGMILFHVSFAALLGGIVYNSLFSFWGILRLTEGETLPNAQIESYDEAERGRFFSPSLLTGETTLVKMHANYEVSGENKRAAYELAVESGEERKRGIIYPTEYLRFEGMRFFASKEGYSVLVVLYEKDGKETYGVFVPLQSYKQPDESYVYATGTSAGPIPFHFPPPPMDPRAVLQLTYLPDRATERAGKVRIEAQEIGPKASGEKRDEQVEIGKRLQLETLGIAPMEIRYWVGIEVRYDPGLVIILSSLTLGLAGMTMTFIGRVRQGASRKQPT